MDLKYDVLTSGYVSMDHIIKLKTPVRTGFTSLVSNKSNTEIFYGGCSVNIAYALCRMGMRAMPVIRVGEDYEQIGFKKFLEDGGVPTEAITRVENEKTSVCYLLQDNNGQHMTLFYPGAMDGVYSQPVDDKYFKNAGLGVITVGARCDNEEFFNRCKAHNIPLVFGMKGDMDAFPKDFLEELLNYCEIIFTNECEREAIEQLLGISLLDLFDSGNAKVIITTLGEDGSSYYYQENKEIKSGQVPIYRGLHVVDTTGSGDAFISGFLYGYLHNFDIKKCCGLGTAASSFVIEQEGCLSGAPDTVKLLERYAYYEKMTGGG